MYLFCLCKLLLYGLIVSDVCPPPSPLSHNSHISSPAPPYHTPPHRMITETSCVAQSLSNTYTQIELCPPILQKKNRCPKTYQDRIVWDLRIRVKSTIMHAINQGALFSYTQKLCSTQISLCHVARLMYHTSQSLQPEEQTLHKSKNRKSLTRNYSVSGLLTENIFKMMNENRKHEMLRTKS